MDGAPALARALAFALEAHGEQVRKGTDVPYVSHLLAVAGLVLEDGGGEEDAIAALLHDAVEDAGGQATLARIRREFGEGVARVVEACSDADVLPKPPWRGRKEAYLARLETAPDEVLRVSLADKLHNARSIVADRRALGEAIWDRFNAPRADQLWYYRALADVFARRRPGRAADELAAIVRQLVD
ncbi:MAG: HD domain-containing protein [Thermoleophilia bacterium]